MGDQKSGWFAGIQDLKPSQDLQLECYKIQPFWLIVNLLVFNESQWLDLGGCTRQTGLEVLGIGKLLVIVGCFGSLWVIEDHCDEKFG